MNQLRPPMSDCFGTCYPQWVSSLDGSMHKLDFQKFVVPVHLEGRFGPQHLAR